MEQLSNFLTEKYSNSTGALSTSQNPTRNGGRQIPQIPSSTNSYITPGNQGVMEIITWLNKYKKTNDYLLNNKTKWIVNNLFLATNSLKQQGVVDVPKELYLQTIIDNPIFYDQGDANPFFATPTAREYIRMADAHMTWPDVWLFANKLGITDKDEVGGGVNAWPNSIISKSSRDSFYLEIEKKYPNYKSLIKAKAIELGVPTYDLSGDDSNVTTNTYKKIEDAIKSMSNKMFIDLQNEDEKIRIDKLEQQRLITQAAADKLRADQKKIDDLAKAEQKKIDDLAKAEQKKRDDLAKAEQKKRDDLAKAEQKKIDDLAKAEQKRKDDLAKAEQNLKDAQNLLIPPKKSNVIWYVGGGLALLAVVLIVRKL